MNWKELYLADISRYGSGGGILLHKVVSYLLPKSPNFPLINWKLSVSLDLKSN